MTFDLTRPDTWGSVRESFTRAPRRLHRQQGDIHPQRLFQLRHRVRGWVDEEQHYSAVMRNAAAPLVLADWSCGRSSPATSRVSCSSPTPPRGAVRGQPRVRRGKAGVGGRSAWCAGSGPVAARAVVVTVRPGFVGSPSLQKVALLDAQPPISPAIRDAIDDGETLSPARPAPQIDAGPATRGGRVRAAVGAPPSGVDAEGGPGKRRAEAGGTVAAGAETVPAASSSSTFLRREPPAADLRRLRPGAGSGPAMAQGAAAGRASTGWVTPKASTMVPRAALCGCPGASVNVSIGRHACVGAVEQLRPLVAAAGGEMLREQLLQPGQLAGRHRRAGRQRTGPLVERHHVELRLDGRDHDVPAVGRLVEWW